MIRNATSRCATSPGVVSHATNVVEHPELVVECIGRFASRQLWKFLPSEAAADTNVLWRRLVYAA
jgi:hypothetical protein